MGIFNYLKSTILSKVVMAATGILLVMFLIGHAVGNLQFFLGKEQYNHYAYLLQSLGEILWILRIVLLTSLVLHVITSLRLNAINNAAKPVKYQVKKYVKSKINSRTMLVTGIMVFAFIVYHLLHFTAGVTNPEHYNHQEYYQTKYYANPNGTAVETIKDEEMAKTTLKPVIMERHDVYTMVVLGFKNPAISLAYIILVIAVGFHLSHAIQSCFQTLGISGPKFTPRMVKCSRIFATVLTLMFISLPITVLIGLVGGGV